MDFLKEALCLFAFLQGADEAASSKQGENKKVKKFCVKKTLQYSKQWKEVWIMFLEM